MLTLKVIGQGRDCSVPTLRITELDNLKNLFQNVLSPDLALLDTTVKQIKVRTRWKREVFSHLPAEGAASCSAGYALPGSTYAPSP